MNPAHDTIALCKVGDFSSNLLHNSGMIASHSAPDIRSSITDVLSVSGIDANRFNFDEHPVIMHYGHVHHNDSFGGSHLLKGKHICNRDIESAISYKRVFQNLP